jgi:hypothetical protein
MTMGFILKDTTPTLTPDDLRAIGEYLTIAAEHLRQVQSPLGVPLSGPLAQRLAGYAEHAEQLKAKLVLK